MAELIIEDFYILRICRSPSNQDRPAYRVYGAALNGNSSRGADATGSAHGCPKGAIIPDIDTSIGISPAIAVNDDILDGDRIYVKGSRCITHEADTSRGRPTRSGVLNYQLARAIQREVAECPRKAKDESVARSSSGGFSEVNGIRQAGEGECDRIVGSSARIRPQLDSGRLCIPPT
jgi:hypothetical protein